MLSLIVELKGAIQSKYQDDKHILPERNDLKKAISSLEMISQY